MFGPLPNVQARQLPSRAQLALEEARDEGELRIALVSWKPHEASDLRLLSAADGCFAVGGLKDELTEDEIAGVLKAVRISSPHIAVFPELLLSAKGLADFIEALQAARRRLPALFVVGCAHQRSGGCYTNVGLVLDAAGGTVLEHAKLEPYRFGDAIEDILPRANDQYFYLDTPVGRLCVNVCRDFRSDLPMLLNRLLGANLVVVPAYSKRLDFVLEEARVLGARQNAIVLAANAANGANRHSVAAYAAIRGQDSSRMIEAASGHGTVQSFSIKVGAGASASFDALGTVAV